MFDCWAEDLFAERHAPSEPYMTDEWEPTNENLWFAVLQVAKGRKRQMTKHMPDGERTIHAPNHGRGFRNWPNQKAVAWAVKQYNGFGGRWRNRKENEGVVTASMANVYDRILKLRLEVEANTHTLEDVVEGRVSVGIEGDSGRDIIRARQFGLFTCNVRGVDIFARCEEDARPLIHYLERGGTYGSLEFSRILGYTDEEIETYRQYLLLSAEIPRPQGITAHQKGLLAKMKAGAVLTSKDGSADHWALVGLESQGMVTLLGASEVGDFYWDISEAGGSIDISA